jgi:hypothetical protein
VELPIVREFAGEHRSGEARADDEYPTHEC